MSRIKKLIASVLIATMIYPNLVVQGEDLEENIPVVEVQEEIKEESSSNLDLDQVELEVEREEDEAQGDLVEDVKEIESYTEENLAEVEQTKEVVLYESISIGEKVPNAYNLMNGEDYIPQEVIEKRQAMLDFKVLVPITDANYEIALAHNDGSYTYLDSADTMESAVNYVESIKENYDNKNTIPAVVSKNGQVVYSTNSMGRIWQHRGGKPTPWQDTSGKVTPLEVTNVYTTSSLREAYTYVNSDYIDDVPIIDINGTSAKVRINGYDGWVNMDVDSGNFEMTVVPMNQVKNPSHYYVKNGQLYHYIANDMTKNMGEAYAGNSIRIGSAPLYLSEGIKYFSYDGIYFYSGNSIEDGLNKLISDIKNNSTKNAVNNTNPYYNYYTYLPFRTRTSYTAEELNKFIDNNTKSESKLRGLGNVLIECQEKYGVNPLLTLGVAINESGWGMSSIAQNKNNIFGMNAVDSSPGESANYFKSASDSVREFTKYYISKGYSDPEDYRYYGGYLGGKAFGANVKYASDPFWGEKAAQHAFTIDLELSGGDINHLRDNNGYQLAKISSGAEIKNSSGKVLYNALQLNGYMSNIVALKFPEVNSTNKYEIFPERNTSTSEGKFSGGYSWNNTGFIDSSALQVISYAKNAFIPGYLKEDVNKDSVIDNNDLNEASSAYNKFTDDSGYKGRYDLNEDGIIDIYDLVLISKKIN